jgi:peptidoglycan/LPS O-acetylase OafA/YrhL
MPIVLSRNQSLDVLRGIAILLVLGHHFGSLAPWRRGGWMGVDLFFVLSGFLISGLLFSEHKRTGQIKFSRFFVRRGFKIYPPYFAFLLLTLPISAHHLGFQDLVFMQSYFQSFWGHLWSLSIEEHFYLALPLVLIVSYRLAPGTEFSWIPRFFPLAVIGCLIMRASVAPDASFITVGSPTHLRFDSLFAGVVLSWFFHFKPNLFGRAKSHYLPIAALALIAWEFAIPVAPYLIHTLGYTANLIAFSLLLLWAMNTRLLERVRPLAAIGKYSYSIYLFHPPLNVFLNRLFQGHPWLGLCAYIATSIVVGVVMSALVELPALALRDRYFPAQQSRTQPDVTGCAEVAVS